MNLVIQGQSLAPATLRRLSKLTGARETVLIDAHACRLHGVRREEADAPVAAFCATSALDWAWVDERRLGDFSLFITDMDSTLINIECIDEIADMQGVKNEVAAITEAAMRGEIDFRTSLVRRVSLLKGLPEQALAKVYAERLRLNPGVEALMDNLKTVGVRTALVSGGFTYFTERLRQELGFDYAWANELEIVNGHLTGRVIGTIIDGRAKADCLTETRDTLGLTPGKVLCAGDGANDIPMFRAAGFGVAYRPKPTLREVADCCLDHVGLEGIARLFD
ncbi:MAG: phosphoserine phosphatase SerB [Azoarcus sp.]|jgi:phosphoserine phosphatase|nr:phosphoserine phosphatase SerB [Azoarcus sp.]